MGLAISVTTDNEQKPSYTSATVAAAAFTLADADLSLWIGASITLTKMEAINAIRNCLAYIRENGTTTPTGANESYAEVASTRKNEVNGAFNAAATIPEEAKVGIWYGPDFQQAAGASISPHVERLIEKYMETVQKAA